MIVYFSGTGNSRYCAKMLADKLEDELLDTFHFIRDGIALELTSTKPWIFVAPTYSWRLPRVFETILRSGYFSGSRDAYFVMTCAGDNGSAAPYNRALCQQIGLRYRGTLSVVMPENYTAMFSIPDPELSKKLIDASRFALGKAILSIRDGEDFPPRKAGVLDHLKSGIVNTLFYRFFVKSSPFSVSDACTSCGKCERSCPLGSISMANGRPAWGKECTHCMACINGCPVQAIEYGRASQGKRRYQCPEYRRGRFRTEAEKNPQ